MNGQCNGVNDKCMCAKKRRSCLASKSTNSRQKYVMKATCPSTLCPSSCSEFIDSLAPGHTAITIGKTVSFSHYSRKTIGNS